MEEFIENGQRRFWVDAPSCSELEADTLFYHYINMAATYFEVLPIDHEFDTLKFSRTHPTLLDAARGFFDKLKEAYDDDED